MTESKSSVSKRIVSYWLIGAEKQFLAYMGAFAVFILYELLVSDSDSLKEGLSFAPGLIMMGGIILIMINALVAIQTTIPMAISFGSTRKEAFIGSQVVNLIMVLQMMVIYIGLIEGMKSNQIFEGYSFSTILLYCGMLLASLGVGQVFAMFLTKLGPKGTAIFSIVLIACICGLMGGLMAINGNLITQLFQDIGKLGIVALVGGLVVYVIGAALNLASIKTLQVKG